MQDRKQDIILLDFAKAKELMLKATKKYLVTDDKKMGSNRYGIYHGESGMKRARNLIIYLNHISPDNKIAILALLLTIFGKPSAGFFGISIGRSSSLGSMIADEYISGEYRWGLFLRERNNLRSEVFSRSSLEKLKSNQAVHCFTANHQSYLDKTTGIRFLIQDILNSAEFVKDKIIIETLAKKLKSVLTSSSSNINLQIFNEAMDQCAKYKGAVTAASLESANPSFPPEIGENISQFFSLKDAGRVARSNKAASNAARNNTPK